MGRAGGVAGGVVVVVLDGSVNDMGRRRLEGGKEVREREGRSAGSN